MKRITPWLIKYHGAASPAFFGSLRIATDPTLRPSLERLLATAGAAGRLRPLMNWVIGPVVET